MTTGISTNPTKRMGVFKHLDDIPRKYRFEHYEDAYRGRDVWDEYLTQHLFERYSSERFKQDVHLAGRRWKTHIEACGRHHALATPEDVERWCKHLLSNLKIKTAYNSYWTKIEQFYTWLLQHTDHPHCYHPMLMAAAEYPAARRIWDEKMERGHK